MHVLHVFNYGWPYIDGYTVRSIGLTTAQQKYLELRVTVATSPYEPFAKGSDPNFTVSGWGPKNQIRAITEQPQPQKESLLQHLERPSMGLTPHSGEMFRRELDSIIERLQPDIIHAHHPHFIGSVAQEVAARRGLPFVYEVRCFNGDYDLDARNPYFLLRGRYQNSLETRVARAADAVVTISDGLARRLRAANVASERLFVVRNSVDTTLFHPLPESPDITPQSTITIGYATTFEAIENLDLLVRAAGVASTALNKAGRKLRVIIAGTGRDWERINELVQEMGLSDVVELPGFVPYSQMPNFYHGLDLFIVPRGEATVVADTTPLKPLEALASGLPMLVSDLPAARELLGKQKGVRFFEPQDNALADAIVDFVNSPWRVDESRSDKSSGIEERNWQREIERYVEVYAAAKRHAQQTKRKGVQPIGEDADSDIGSGESLAHQSVNSSPLRRLIKKGMRTAVDRGLFGLRPLQTHVVICGFPRAGSTLLQLMAQCCVDDMLVFSGEVEGLWAAECANRQHSYMLTKLPADIEHISALRNWYDQHPGNAHFVFTLRDPRDVLTSIHKAYPDERGYYVTPERWHRVYGLMQRYKHDNDVTLVRYEDLITQPAEVQRILTDAIGWRVIHPFTNFNEIAAQTVARDSMTEGALGGLRPLDASALGRWQEPRHAKRLRTVLKTLPDLPQILIDLGYEDNNDWVEKVPAEKTDVEETLTKETVANKRPEEVVDMHKTPEALEPPRQTLERRDVHG